ncbi:LamG domain-containing protein [bacterium]|nr:LamG domain-containing protein [bacterium]
MKSVFFTLLFFMVLGFGISADVTRWSLVFAGSGSARTLEPADYFSAGTGSSFSIAAWVYFDLYPGSNANILHKRLSAVHSCQINFFLVPGGSLSLGIDDFSNLGWQIFTSSSVVPAGRWVHVAVVKSGTTVKFYIDGVEESGVGTQTIDPNPANGYWSIGTGGDGLGGSSSFPGKINDVGVWQAALSQNNIKSVMAVGPGASVGATLVHYWRTTDGTNWVDAGNSPYSLTLSGVTIGDNDFDGDGVLNSYDDYPNSSSQVRDLPAEFPSAPTIWYEFSVTKNVRMAGLNKVFRLMDISGNQNHTVQSSPMAWGTIDPTTTGFRVATPSLVFDGTSTSYNIPNGINLVSTNYTVFVVEKRASSDANRNAFILGGSGGTLNGNFAMGYLSNGSFTQTQLYNDLNSSEQNWLPAVPRTWTARLNGTGRVLYCGTNLIASSSVSTQLNANPNWSLGWYLDNLQYYFGNIGEVIITS